MYLSGTRVIGPKPVTQSADVLELDINVNGQPVKVATDYTFAVRDNQLRQ
jgi:hypothetical protein